MARRARRYRDTLLWETVKEIAPKGRVVLISADKDFSDDGHTLAAALVEEVVGKGLEPERVTLRVSLEEFLDEFVKPDVDAVKELVTLFEEDEGGQLDLLADVEQLLEDEIGNGSPVDYSPRKYDDISDQQITALNPPIFNADIGYGRLVSNDELLFEVTGSVSAEVEFFLPKWELWSLPDEEMPEVEERGLERSVRPRPGSRPSRIPSGSSFLAIRSDGRRPPTGAILGRLRPVRLMSEIARLLRISPVFLVAPTLDLVIDAPHRDSLSDRLEVALVHTWSTFHRENEVMSAKQPQAKT